MVHYIQLLLPRRNQYHFWMRLAFAVKGHPKSLSQEFTFSWSWHLTMQLWKLWQRKSSPFKVWRVSIALQIKILLYIYCWWVHSLSLHLTVTKLDFFLGCCCFRAQQCCQEWPFFSQRKSGFSNTVVAILDLTLKDVFLASRYQFFFKVRNSRIQHFDALWCWGGTKKKLRWLQIDRHLKGIMYESRENC